MEGEEEKEYLSRVNPTADFFGHNEIDVYETAFLEGSSFAREILHIK